jgi:flagellar basal body-associated protein FliL
MTPKEEKQMRIAIINLISNQQIQEVITSGKDKLKK